MQKIDIKNAATIILLRGSRENPQVLMGQRGKNASFMPNKFVFPGGALDPSDSEIDFEEKISETCLEKLKLKADISIAQPLIAAGIRELWEETGLILGTSWNKNISLIPENWKGFLHQVISLMLKILILFFVLSRLQVARDVSMQDFF